MPLCTFEPLYSSLRNCEVGCEMGNCFELNQTDSYTCQCAGHNGFHCRSQTVFKTGHLILILILGQSLLHFIAYES